MLEIWKPVLDFPNYEVSNFGKVRNSKTGRVKSTKFHYRGYVIISLWRKDKEYMKKIHRLVAQAFIPNPENKETVNHKDGNKLNNCVDNLEWMTMTENRQHAHRIGLFDVMKGQNNSQSVLTNDDVIFIIDNKGVIKGKDLAKKFNVSQGLISMIQSKKRWKHL